jgi:phage N-6-adenine-methyltransferase
MERDCWATPSLIYEEICKRWNLAPLLDVCADVRNTKCEHYLTAKQDALQVDWTWYLRATGLAPVFWMNPPYSQPLMTRFIEKAIEESKRGGTTLFLLPAWVDQGWYHDLIRPYPHEFKRGRIKFEPPSGVKSSSPRYGNIHGVISEL